MTKPTELKGSQFLGVISSLALLLNTLFWGVFLYTFIILRLLLPARIAEKTANPVITSIASVWLGGIMWWINHIYKVQWDIDGLNRLGKKDWYLINANHQSWVDIFVLYKLYHRKVPLLKFFIKKELPYIPIVGQAWWALDFPFMRRYSKEFLAKHPEKAGDDMKETQKACEKFSRVPTAVMNFLEGTRFTQAKHDQQQSPFAYLLKPKAGGLAFAIQALGDKFSALTNVTIYYPDGIPTFWDMMCGAFKRCVVRVQEQAIPAEFAHGDYQNDPQLKKAVQDWVTEIWENKDQQMAELDKQYHS